MIFVGQESLRHALTQYVAHYHGERNHQGLGNRLLQPLAADIGEPYGVSD
jgi:putative transposase